MLNVKLHAAPEAERFFAQRLFLREKFKVRCPKCKAFDAGLWSGVCPVCAGRRFVEFELSAEVIA